jgi:hypothetical protein
MISSFSPRPKIILQLNIITNSEGEYQDDLINKYPTFTNPNTQIKRPIQDQINLINPNLMLSFLNFSIF